MGRKKKEVPLAANGKTRKRTYTVEIPERRIVISRKSSGVEELAKKIAALQEQARKEGFEEGYKKGYKESEGKIRKARKTQEVRAREFTTEKERKRLYAQGYNAGRRKGREDMASFNANTVLRLSTVMLDEDDSFEPDNEDYI